MIGRKKETKSGSEAETAEGREQGGVRQAANEMYSALGAVAAEGRSLLQEIQKVMLEPGDRKGELPASLILAVEQAVQQGPGTVAVVQDRIKGKPGFVVMYEEPGKTARIFEQVTMQAEYMSEAQVASWPAAGDSRSQVWTARGRKK